MPEGKGTYGSQVGRPSMKKKKKTLPFARKKPDPKSANKLMKKLNKGK